VTAGLGAVQSVSSVLYHTCVVLRSGTVECWGLTTRGQTDVPADLTGVRAIAVGFRHSCALFSGIADGQAVNGSVTCWGGDETNQAPADLPPAQAIDAGPIVTCALLFNDTLRCWGDPQDSDFLALIPPSDMRNVVAISVGFSHACALVRYEAGDASTVRVVECWGDNSDGQTDVPADLTDVVEVRAGGLHSCARLVGGSVRCWGLPALATVPTDLTPPGVQALAIAVGGYRSCALLSTGTFSCWGEEVYDYIPGWTDADVGPACT